MQFLKDRFKELSSYLGFLLVALATYLSFHTSPDDPGKYLSPLLDIIGALGFAMPEKGQSQTVEQIVQLVLTAIEQSKKSAGLILLMAALAGAATLSACGLANPDGSAMTTAQATDFALQVACGAYSSDKAPLAVAVEDGLIDAQGAAALATAEALADAVCTGPAPTDLKSAIVTVNNAAVQIVLAVAEANKKAAGHPTAPGAAPVKS